MTTTRKAGVWRHGGCGLCSSLSMQGPVWESGNVFYRLQNNTLLKQRCLFFFFIFNEAENTGWRTSAFFLSKLPIGWSTKKRTRDALGPRPPIKGVEVKNCQNLKAPLRLGGFGTLINAYYNGADKRRGHQNVFLWEQAENVRGVALWRRLLVYSGEREWTFPFAAHGPYVLTQVASVSWSNKNTTFSCNTS